jgi:hypothetical protein
VELSRVGMLKGGVIKSTICHKFEKAESLFVTPNHEIASSISYFEPVSFRLVESFKRYTGQQVCVIQNKFFQFVPLV